MAPFQEDIFGCYPAQTIIIRYGEPTRKKFDAANNNVHFEKFKDTLSKREYTCYFTKQKDKEHRIYIPVDDFHGRVELVVSKRDPNTNTYKLEVNKQKQTRICAASIEDIPEDKYRIEQVCRLFFIESNAEYDDWDVISELNKLIKRVESLEISPKTLVENQREIWTKYIEAQEFIIKNLQVPFECKGDTYLEEIRNNNKVTRYKLRLPLAQAFENDYSELENELQNKLHLECKFDMDGSVKLKFSDIRYLDNAIKYKFPTKYERNPIVVCIAKIKPMTLVQRLLGELPGSKIERDKKSSRIFISARHPVKAIDDVFARFRMCRSGEYAASFEITNVEDLYSHSSVKRYNLTFGPGDEYLKKGTTDGPVPLEMLLPPPINDNTFRVCMQNREELVRFYLSLCFIYGKDNISVTEFLVFCPQQDDVLNDRQFDDETWNFIRRELAYKYQINEKKDEKEVIIEFVQYEELRQKVQELLELHSFAFVKNPLDEDFQFKVKTVLLAKKSQRQLFEEKLQKLRGAEFVCLRESQKDNEKALPNIKEVYIGKLAPESSQNQLVFNIPMHFKEDKERACEFLSFIKTNPKIKSVHANLRGDESKTKWLREAMDKLKDGSQNSQKPNACPINDNIKNFIFDSSKARPTVKFELTDIRETSEYRDSHKYEILEINESQREAVLKAVQANDLCLLQGPPGTGKTTVIAELIWQHIRLNQSQRILLTSETNLAVDNALEKMMGEKNIRKDLARYITIIKPLRFGKATRFEEEGKKYSIERIDKWVEEEYVQEEQYMEEQLGQEEYKTDVDVEIEDENTNSNAVQDWMRHIATRADQKNEKFSEVLKNWTNDMVFPNKDTKLYFRNKYFKYANVIGSTCSSTGSPAFAREYVGLYHSVPDDFNKKKKEVDWLVEKAPQSLKIRKLLSEMGVPYGDDLGNDADSYKELMKEFLKIDFDVVVMDEASKATPPDLLMPLCFGKKSIVIGDHRQLPPMLHSRTFKETLETISDAKFKSQIDDIIDKEFVETSQFKRMITNPSLSPTIKSTFDTQYRMHPDINDVINQFYLDDESGGLHCGLDLKSVNDPKLENPQSRYHGFSCEGFINENVHTIWIDVDAPEKIDGTSRVNATEVEAVKHVLELLKKSHGFDEYMKFWDEHVLDKTKRKFEKEVGIISFYGKQVALLRDVRLTAQKAGIPIRLNTVDKFQGMERNIVIVSTVRSDKRDDGNQKIVPNNDYGFAESAERLNVALSRAKRLLIVIGNKEFFYKAKSSDGKPLYKNAIDSIRKHGRIIDYEKLRNELD